MGDITPKPKSVPPPDPNPNQDSALGEAPGSAVTMPDIPGWNAEAPEPTPAPKGYFPKVDLIAALQRAGAPPPPPAPAPAPVAPAATPADHPAPVSNRLLILLTVLGVIVVSGLGAYYFFFRPQELPRPVVIPTTTPTPTPTPRPTRTPSFTPTPAPPVPPPVQPKTYVVQPGDTLITIGEKLGKDWHAIAAANGQITDPNFITPGQVLVIP